MYPVPCILQINNIYIAYPRASSPWLKAKKMPITNSQSHVADPKFSIEKVY